MTALVPAGVDRDAVLRHLNLDPNDVSTQTLLLVCDRYGLDPLLKHMLLIKGRPYITRDGYLHVAHQSGQFDGLEVVEQGDHGDEWWAKVSVYRRDMTHPFTFVGRYPKSGQQKQYGPEMAVKCAEVAALRRAFDVTGMPAADEQWDTPDTVTEPTVPVDYADDNEVDQLVDAIADLDDAGRADLKLWWKAERLPPLTSGRLTAGQAAAVWLTLGELEATDELLDGEGVDG